MGTAITETLNNVGKPKSQQKSAEQILDVSLKAATVGAVMSTITAGINYGVDFAQNSSLGYNSWANSLNPGVGLAPITPAFGEMMKGFFGTMDDAIASMMLE